MASLEYNCEALAIALLTEQAGLAGVAIVHEDESAQKSGDRVVCKAEQREVGVEGIKPWAPLAWRVPVEVTIILATNNVTTLDAWQAAISSAFTGTASAPIIALATTLALPGLNIRDTESGEHEQEADERTRAKTWDFYVNA